MFPWPDPRDSQTDTVLQIGVAWIFGANFSNLFKDLIPSTSNLNSWDQSGDSSTAPKITAHEEL
jgi:hypothetical protein